MDSLIQSPCSSVANTAVVVGYVSRSALIRCFWLTQVRVPQLLRLFLMKDYRLLAGGCTVSCFFCFRHTPVVCAFRWCGLSHTFVAKILPYLTPSWDIVDAEMNVPYANIRELSNFLCCLKPEVGQDISLVCFFEICLSHYCRPIPFSFKRSVLRFLYKQSILCEELWVGLEIVIKGNECHLHTTAVD